jgi:hypothetical protein
MTYIMKSLRQIYDSETGWEVERPFGDHSVSPATLALVPKNVQRGPGPSPYVISRNMRFYVLVVGAGYRLAGENYIFFDTETLRKCWDEVAIFGRGEIAPEIDSFEEFLQFLDAGLQAFVLLTKCGMPRPDKVIIG